MTDFWRNFIVGAVCGTVACVFSAITDVNVLWFLGTVFVGFFGSMASEIWTGKSGLDYTQEGRQ